MNHDHTTQSNPNSNSNPNRVDSGRAGQAGQGRGVASGNLLGDHIPFAARSCKVLLSTQFPSISHQIYRERDALDPSLQFTLFTIPFAVCCSQGVILDHRSSIVFHSTLSQQQPTNIHPSIYWLGWAGLAVVRSNQKSFHSRSLVGCLPPPPPETGGREGGSISQRTSIDMRVKCHTKHIPLALSTFPFRHNHPTHTPLTHTHSHIEVLLVLVVVVVVQNEREGPKPNHTHPSHPFHSIPPTQTSPPPIHTLTLHSGKGKERRVED